MPNYLIRLSFIGTNYHGWQYQPKLPTVQGELLKALGKLFPGDLKLIGCCRTDAGVHAEDFVANFHTQGERDTTKILLALNSLLPEDIGVREVRKVSEDFNARYSVKGKVYLYRLWICSWRDPFMHPFCWKVRGKIDINLLEKALSMVSGTKDFRNFAKLEEEKKTVIDLETDLKVRDCLIEIYFKASHFLRYMVRKITGALVSVSQKKIGLEDLEKFFTDTPCPYRAPSRGLTLKKVILPEDDP